MCPRKVECAARAVRIMVEVGQLHCLLAILRHECREGDFCRPSRSDRELRPEGEDGIEDCPHRPRQVAGIVHRDWVSRASSPPDEPRSVGLAGDTTLDGTACNDMPAP